jgi:hypothetical protein
MEAAMCDSNWTSRGKELESLEKSWREFGEFARRVKQRWSKRRIPAPAAPGTETPRQPRPAAS